MENDSIRSSGENTLVSIWVEGKLRGIVVSREAIEAFLRLPRDRAQAMTEDDRREFVRTHLGLVTAAAKNQLLADPAADTVTIGPGQLGGQQSARADDRREGGDRRKGDRRKVNRPVAIDRRRS